MSKQILNNVCCFVSIILLIGCLLTLAGCGDIKLNISRQSKVVNVTTSANSRPTISWSIGGDIKKLGERTLFYIEKLACFKFAQKPKVAGAVAGAVARNEAKRSKTKQSVDCT